jgi:hypothetical protein
MVCICFEDAAAAGAAANSSEHDARNRKVHQTVNYGQWAAVLVVVRANAVLHAHQQLVADSLASLQNTFAPYSPYRSFQ